MSRAHCYVGDMLTGFILLDILKATDEVDELLNKNEEWIDGIINTSDISLIYEDSESKNCVIMLMSSEREITVKQSLDEIIQKIKRATAITFITQ
jgi:uncharacterized protein YlzI (FlbEa/FlbD family)